jgi:hypothetical protein
MTPKFRSLLTRAGLTQKAIEVWGRKLSRYDVDQVIKGFKDESEHEGDAEAHLQIVLDHLKEKPDYYDRLDKAMGEAKVMAADLRGWVNDYKKARHYGNVRDAKWIKMNIDQEIRRHGLDAAEVYGSDPDDPKQRESVDPIKAAVDKLLA